MKKRKVAWGITGSGDKLENTVEILKQIKDQYEEEFDIGVYVSKAGDQVLKYYGLFKPMTVDYEKVWVEINANAPFLAGQIQLGKFEFMLIAPATSNTVAKLSLRIGDSLITNAAIMAQKANVPVYIMPSDIEEGTTITKLPDGSDLKLTIRKEDVEHVKKLETMENTYILKSPEDIFDVFKKYSKI